jgi:hypothetical protein
MTLSGSIFTTRNKQATFLSNSALCKYRHRECDWKYLHILSYKYMKLYNNIYLTVSTSSLRVHTVSCRIGGYQGRFLWGQSGQGVKLATYLQLMARTSMVEIYLCSLIRHMAWYLVRQFALTGLPAWRVTLLPSSTVISNYEIHNAVITS